MKRITEKLEPTAKTHTQYGFITHADWCKREAHRINTTGGFARVTRAAGLVYLEGGAK